MRRSDTISRVVTSFEYPHGGLGCFQYPAEEGWPKDGIWAAEEFPTGAYYDPIVQTVCAPNKGCNKNPRRKFGKAGREMWRDF